MRATMFTRCCCLLWTAILAASFAEPAISEAQVGAGARVIVAAGDEIGLLAPPEGGRIEAALDGGLLRPVAGALAAPAAGSHWLAVASRDAAGNLSPIRWVEVQVDGRPPAVELTTRPAIVTDEAGRSWLPAGAEAWARASDDLAGVERVTVEVDGEARESAGREAVAAVPGEGRARLRAWAVDAVGNRSPEQTLDVTIDGEPPSVAVLAAVPWRPGPDGGVEGALIGPDGRLGVEVRDPASGGVTWTPEIDGEPASYEALRGPWEAGAHTVAVTAVDRVGNTRRVGPLRFTVDAEQPEISWRVITPGATGDDGESYYRPPVEIVAEARDALAGVFELRSTVDGRRYLAVEGPISVDGDRLTLHAFDKVANATKVTATWNLDQEPPEVELIAPGGRVVAAGGRLTVARGDELEIRAVDRGAGIARASYVMNRRLPPGHQPPRPLPERLRCDRTGHFFLEIEAEDRLGNALSGRWIVVVRRAAPASAPAPREVGR